MGVVETGWGLMTNTSWLDMEDVKKNPSSIIELTTHNDTSRITFHSHPGYVGRAQLPDRDQAIHAQGWYSE